MMIGGRRRATRAPRRRTGLQRQYDAIYVQCMANLVIRVPAVSPPLPTPAAPQGVATSSGRHPASRRRRTPTPPPEHTAAVGAIRQPG